jgi:hypothetical protein
MCAAYRNGHCASVQFSIDYHNANIETRLTKRIVLSELADAPRSAGEAPEVIGWVRAKEERLRAFFQFGENMLGNFAQGLKHPLAGDGDALGNGFAFYL